jgi:hypothetical protein
MFALLLLEHLGRRLIFSVLPIASTGGTTPGFLINLALVAAMVAGLVLSLWNQASRQPLK